MDQNIHIKPLSYETRQRTFLLLIVVFLVVLPFLYLYATGYRFDFEKPTNLVSTGGIYVAVDKTAADIYIDNELVRETRTFRKAFYAQRLDAGTHRVHVQKEGYHTWVKELPVSKHLVTEAEAFNLPLVPQVRVVSKWQSATGTTIVDAVLVHASSTNELLATTTKNIKAFVVNEEYETRISQFEVTGTSTVHKDSVAERIGLIGKEATSTELGVGATTTVISGGVRLHQAGDDVYATWVGSFEEMPYYYCAPDFPPYTTATTTTPLSDDVREMEKEIADELLLEEKSIVSEDGVVVHPIQTVPKDTSCEPTIRIDRKWQTIRDFDFLPNSTDFVMLVLGDGIYVVEIDDRGWQNVQPLLKGDNLEMYIENGNIFVYDGTLIYQVLMQSE